MNIKSVIKKILLLIVKPLILLKYKADSKVLPLSDKHKKTYIQLHFCSLMMLFRFPNLIECKDYNDKIQWLKLFDNSELMIECVDKILVRKYVLSILGEGYLPELYCVADKFENLDFYSLPERFVLKTNHDSGTVFLVRDKKELILEDVSKRVDKALNQKFGDYGGEWPYLFVKPMVFVEEYLGYDVSNRPADYKFHCVNGEVKWLQYIYERGAATGTKEVIIDANGNVLDVHFDTDMVRGEKFEIPECFDEMVRVSEKLSKCFKYVRVDLYLILERIVVGEMTFFPMSGCYKGEGQYYLGKYLDFDMSSFSDEIIC